MGSAVGFLGRPRAPHLSVEAQPPASFHPARHGDIDAVSCWNHAPRRVFVPSAPASAACLGKSFRRSAPGAGSPRGTFLRKAAAGAMTTFAITFIACHWRLGPETCFRTKRFLHNVKPYRLTDSSVSICHVGISVQ